jgi:hypothetical protein
MSTVELEVGQDAEDAPDAPDLELVPLSDDELTAQALAADPDTVVDGDALPFGACADPTGVGGLLPSWYMPVPVTGSRKRWHRALVIAAIIGFVVINASGFCITYGILEGA